MNITVNGRNIAVTPSLKDYALEKIGKFGRYLSDNAEATVTLSVQKHRHSAEVHIKADGSMLQAQSITDELYSAIDEVSTKIDKQIKKLKGKLVTNRKTAEKAKARASAIVEAPAETGRIIKKRVSSPKPMSPEEASMQIDITKMGFLVFINSITGRLNVIYKMSDGNFGLIEPVK